jgi:hypothetical protein
MSWIIGPIVGKPANLIAAIESRNEQTNGAQYARVKAMMIAMLEHTLETKTVLICGSGSQDGEGNFHVTVDMQTVDLAPAVNGG